MGVTSIKTIRVHQNNSLSVCLIASSDFGGEQLPDEIRLVWVPRGSFDKGSCCWLSHRMWTFLKSAENAVALWFSYFQSWRGSSLTIPVIPDSYQRSGLWISLKEQFQTDYVKKYSQLRGPMVQPVIHSVFNLWPFGRILKSSSLTKTYFFFGKDCPTTKMKNKTPSEQMKWFFFHVFS